MQLGNATPQRSNTADFLVVHFDTFVHRQSTRSLILRLPTQIDPSQISPKVLSVYYVSSPRTLSIEEAECILHESLNTAIFQTVRSLGSRNKGKGGFASPLTVPTATGRCEWLVFVPFVSPTVVAITKNYESKFFSFCVVIVMKRGKQKESQSNKRVYKFQVPENYNVINEPNGESVSTSTRLDHENYNFFRTARAQTELNDLLLFREQPRQLLFLVLVVLVISYYTFTHDSDDMSQNIHAGIISGAFIFLVYCFLQTRDGLLVRPHPGLWRLVHGCSVMYLLLLAVLSVQGRTSAPVLLQFLFPRIGSSKKTISAALNCEINSTNIYNGISSIWFFAHVTGWWGKMCMFRDWRFCLVLSIAFEILELSLQFMIPDFKECWWDSLFMDTFGANLLGMLLGRLTLQYYESKEYDWSGKPGRNITGKSSLAFADSYRLYLHSLCV
uniref:Phosphatidylserine synthase putative n=1 Tax=Albugo laibachii Nc14 TaxID=890382 RepID=F0W7D1_9STRA|nr:phosphatidylserine synthase putative [Albugo laibachii Nc14]|eukprot:CCA17030.1 phosphatidylserine synthase putative [Albugo laibachii Nc14]